jgi:hypothetical protein
MEIEVDNMDPITLRKIRRARIAWRIDRFLHAILTNLEFQQRLQTRAVEAFAEHHFHSPHIPEVLPILGKRISVYLDDETLFGPNLESAEVSPPLELRLVQYGAKPQGERI